MNLRLTTAAGFLAATTLLSGSAFAFAPQFTDDLPTIIITDEIKAPSGGVFDPAQGTSRAIFRFTDALDLFDYISTGSATESEVRMLFTEYPVDGLGNISPVAATGGQRILLIEGNLAAESEPVAKSEFDLTPAGEIDSPLDFWNRDFTDENLDVNNPLASGTFVGSITGHNVISAPQERVVNMYLAGGPSEEVSDPSVFFVVTTIGEGDSLSAGSGSTTPWSEVIPPSNDFGSWTASGLGLMALIPTSGTYDPLSAWNGPGPAQNSNNAIGTSFTDYAGLTPTPGTTTAGGTTSITVAVSAANKVGYVGLNRPSANILEANKLYRLRSRISSSVAAQREEWRVRFGEPAGDGTTGSISSGNLKSTVADNRPTLGTTAVDHNSYLLTKGTGSTNPFSIFYEVVSEGNAQSFEAISRGQTITVTEFELSVSDRGDLGGKNVLINHGGTFSVFAGEQAPEADDLTPLPGSVAAFNLHNMPRTTAMGTANAFFTVTVNAPSSAPNNAQGFPWFTRVNLYGGDAANASVATGIPTVADKIYIADVWVSSQKASVQVKYPQLRVGFQVSSMMEFGLWNLDTDKVTGIRTSPRAYHSVLQRQDKGYTLPDPSYGHIAIDFLASDGANTHLNAPIDLVIHRITVTEYDAN